MRYLIIKTSSFGDIVQTYPVIEYIKERSPNASVDWVVEKKMSSLVKSHPLVDRTIEINAKEWKKNLLARSSWQELYYFFKELRAYKYDALFDLQGNAKSAFVTKFAKAFAKVGFGFDTVPEKMNSFFLSHRFDPPKGQNIRRDYLFITESYFNDFSPIVQESVLLKTTNDAQEKERLSTILEALPRTSWMICPYSNWRNKQLPDAKMDLFLEKAVADFAPFFIFVSGTAYEKKRAEELHLKFPNSIVCDRISLPALQHVMRQVELVISMDSLPLHLAGTTHAKTFSFFGPSLSCKYRPFGDRNFSYQGSCPYDIHFEKRCPQLRTCPTGACLHDVNIRELYDYFYSWWQSASKSISFSTNSIAL